MIGMAEINLRLVSGFVEVDVVFGSFRGGGEGGGCDEDTNRAVI